MKLNLILLDSSLELVPKEIASHPAIVKNAKKRNKKPEETLLDISLHYHAMNKLKDFEKRGRPDIVHMAMVLFLTEIPEVKGEFYIHTIDSKIIWIDNKMRPPKNYDRFVGLMEQLLKEGKVPVDKEPPLMKIIGSGLNTLKSKYKIVVLSEHGKKVTPDKLCELDNDWLVGIGAFQHGDFSQEVLDNADEIYSISNYTLEAHQVLCRVVSACNMLLNWP